MFPVNFPEANVTIQPPSDAPEVKAIRVLRHSEGFVSKWRMTWRERIRAVLFGSVYLYTAGQGLSPANIQCKRRLTDRNEPK